MNSFKAAERRFVPLLFSVLVLMAYNAPAQSRKESKVSNQYQNPAGLSKPTGYTHVVTTQPGKMVYVAGQVALNAKGEVIGKGDLAAQTAQVFENLKTALAAGGATFADVVKLNYYVVNMKPTDPAVIREARAKFLAEHPPASTLVGVTALANPDFMIEIEAIAVVR